MLGTCVDMIGVVLASPDRFTITYVHVLSLPLTITPEILADLVDWLGLDVIFGTWDTVVVPRSRCLEPLTDVGAPG